MGAPRISKGAVISCTPCAMESNGVPRLIELLRSLRINPLGEQAREPTSGFFINPIKNARLKTLRLHQLFHEADLVQTNLQEEPREIDEGFLTHERYARCPGKQPPVSIARYLTAAGELTDVPSRSPGRLAASGDRARPCFPGGETQCPIALGRYGPPRAHWTCCGEPPGAVDRG